jgi:catechol 2,3-dioxygenase-like lactoylglutathione lyase family enzyme
MEPRISIITLGVSDLERSRSFYRDGLGLPLSPDSNDSIAFFPLGGAWLALFPRAELAHDALVPAEGSGFTGITVAHAAKSKADVDAVLKQAEAAGARITKQAQDVFWGGYSGYFTDPDGFLWEVLWNPMIPSLASL